MALRPLLHGPGALLHEGTFGLMRRIKQALDPHGILNPGKVFSAPTVLNQNEA